MIADLAYVLEHVTGCVFIVRFTTTSGLVAARLCYVPDDHGDLLIDGRRFRKCSVNETRLTEYQLISTFPRDDVYMIPMNRIRDSFPPLFQFEWPVELDKVAVLFLDRVRTAIHEAGGRLGVIGSLRFGASLRPGRDIDLVVSCATAWWRVRELIGTWLQQGEAVLDPSDRYPDDRLRATLMNLTENQLIEMRSSQWWRHIRVGNATITFSYSRMLESRPIVFEITDDTIEATGTGGIQSTPPVAPYSLSVRSDSERHDCQIATACWFLRDGLPGVHATFYGHAAIVERKTCLWLNELKCL